MNEIAGFARQILKAIKEFKDKETKSIDTQAQVKRVEGDTLWVHIPGGVDETPVKKTVDAKEGDQVQVRISGGRAWVTGNGTAPPTDDSVAYGAAQAAADAGWKAQAAEEGALNAQRAAKDAAEAAVSAQNSADVAGQAADSALVNLAEIENVVGTLNWITAHGTMTLTTDVAIDPTHVYFVRDPNGDYHVGDYYYSIVTEPKTEELSTYYVLTVDESIQNYVATHVAVDAEGLWLLPESSGAYKILIATGAGTVYTSPGTYIIDISGNTVAKFGEEVVIGSTSNGDFNILIETTEDFGWPMGRFVFRIGNSEGPIIYSDKNTMHISNGRPWLYHYILSSDTSVVTGKTYYTRSGTSGNYTYTAIENPTGNPELQGYYEYALQTGVNVDEKLRSSKWSVSVQELLSMMYDREGIIEVDSESVSMYIETNYTGRPHSGFYAKFNSDMSKALAIIDGDNFSVDEDGTVKSNGSEVMPLKVVENANANDLTSTGLYHVKATLSNFPRTNWGLLVVQNFGTLFQLYFPDATEEMWRRHYASGAWTSWKKVTFS